MDTTTLQIPLPKSLKNEATNVAREYGFSSLQEVVRFILTKFAKREFGIAIEQFPAVTLSARNEKRYAKMNEDFKKGKNIFATDSVDKFLKELSS